MFRKEELIVRAVKALDFDFLFKLENDEAYWHLSDSDQTFTAKELRDFISRAQQPILLTKQFRYIIEIENRGQIGCIDLFDFDPINKFVGVGIIIYDETYRRKGYAKGALLLIESYVREVLDCNFIFAYVLEDNKASVSLFKAMNYLVVTDQTDHSFEKDKNRINQILFQKKLK